MLLLFSNTVNAIPPCPHGIATQLILNSVNSGVPIDAPVSSAAQLILNSVNSGAPVKAVALPRYLSRAPKLTRSPYVKLFDDFPTTPSNPGSDLVFNSKNLASDLSDSGISPSDFIGPLFAVGSGLHKTYETGSVSAGVAKSVAVASTGYYISTFIAPVCYANPEPASKVVCFGILGATSFYAHVMSDSIADNFI